MSNQQSAYQFAGATFAQIRGLTSDDHQLVIRQGPLHAKVFVGKEKDRKPIDPPPIIQLRVDASKDPSQSFLQSPYYFVSCSLLDDDESRTQTQREEVKNALAGTLVSSLHRLKDADNFDGAFFVFGDLSVKVEGTFRLQFTLYEVRGDVVEYIKAITSDPFQVHAAKNFPGMSESTFLTRSFSDQGVRLRLRKEPRFRLGPRGPASDDYQPRHYNTQKRRQSQLSSMQSDQQLQGLIPQASQAFSPQYRHPQDFTPAQQYASQHYPQHAQAMPHIGGHGSGELVTKRPSQSSRSGSYSGSYHGEDPFPKRIRTDSEQNQQATYSHNYPLQASQYGERQYSTAIPAQQFGGFTQQQPAPSHPTQMFGGGYSPAQMTMSNREQGNFVTVRRTDPHFAAAPSSYESSVPRGPPASFQQLTAPSQHFFGGSGVPPQPQYPLYVSQPLPSSRGAFGMPTFASQQDYEHGQPSRPSTVLPSDMPPPNYNRTLLTNSATQGGASQLPTPANPEDVKFGGNWSQQYRSREGHR